MERAVVMNMFQVMCDGLIGVSTVPFFPFLVTLFIGGKCLRSKKRAYKLAMDVTTLFLIAAVGGLYNTIFHSTVGFYWILFLMLLLAGLFGGLQQQKYNQLHIWKLVRLLWRLSFLMLSVSYILLLPIGIFVYWTNM